MRIRQSAIESYSRCPQQKKLSDEVQARGEREANLSATVFGTVIHHALQVLETLHYEGREDAADVAVATFERYWGEDLRQLEPGGIDIWLPRQTWQGFMTRGRANLREYADMLKSDRGFLLGLEIPFEGPLLIPTENARWEMSGAGILTADETEEHTAAGTIDRLAFRNVNGRLFLSVEDFKSGAKKTYLRYAFQWTYYSWASLQPWFWAMWTEEQLEPVTSQLRRKNLALYDDGSGLPVIPRRGRWLSVRESFKVHDCGWRTAADYARMMVGLREYVRAHERDVFPLNISGQTCQYCGFGQTGECGGVPLGEIEEGIPT